MSIKVSVVIPVYNPGRYIEPCVESLLRQSMPADEYEIIFVDDGSTDETPAYLDQLATDQPNVRAIHISNSGWPGKPRNVGVDVAAGEYVQFVDQDDHLAADALRQLYAMGARNGSDIVIGKVASNFRGVPHGVFRANREKCTIYDFNLIDSLTPHKMFRTEFLRDTGIKYAEGKRRLEDQLYMVETYFAAKVVSILGSYTCYYYSRRDDGKNAGTARLVPSGYYGNLREVLDVVNANTEPGEFRDKLVRRFYRVEMLGRISEPSMVKYDDDHRAELIDEIDKLVADFVTDGVHNGLPGVLRLRSTLLRRDLRPELVELARRCQNVGAVARLDDLAWQPDGRMSLAVTAELVVGPDKAPLRLIRRAGRYVLDPSFADGLLPAADAVNVTDEIETFRAEIGLRDRETAVEWPCASDFTVEIEEIGPMDGGSRAGVGSDADFGYDIDGAARNGGVACRVILRGTGVVDPKKSGSRDALATGMWDLWVRVSGLGFTKRARLGADRAAHVDARCLPALLGKPARLTVPYFTNPGDNLTLDVNRRSKKLGPVVADLGVRQVAAGNRWTELELPVVATPKTATTEVQLVLRDGDEIVGQPLPATLAGFGDRLHLRTDADLGFAVRRSAGGLLRLGVRLDGPRGADVIVADVIPGRGRRLTLSGIPSVDPTVTREARSAHRRATVRRRLHRSGRPVLRLLPKPARERIRTWARALGF
jgi:poly(ribitol-phosphate) beta-N-acetylglucosaminyltransferase